MTKAEVIANAKEMGASESEIEILQNTPNHEYEGPKVDVENMGKTDDIASDDASAVSTNTASESTGLGSEDGSSGSEDDSTTTVEFRERPGWWIVDENGFEKQVSASEYLSVMEAAENVGYREQYHRDRVANTFYVDETLFYGKVDETDLRKHLNTKLRGLNVKIVEKAAGHDVLEFTYGDGTKKTISFDDWGLFQYRTPVKDGLPGQVEKQNTNKQRANIINALIDSQIDYLSDPDSDGYDPLFDFGIYSGAWNIINEVEELPEWGVEKESLGTLNPKVFMRPEFNERDNAIMHAIHNNTWEELGYTSKDIEGVKASKFMEVMQYYMDSPQYKIASAEIAVELDRVSTEIMNDIMEGYTVIPTYDDNGEITGYTEDPNWVKNATLDYERRYAGAANGVWENNENLNKALGNITLAVNTTFDEVIHDAKAKEGIIDMYGPTVGNSDFLSAIAKFIDFKMPKQYHDFNVFLESIDKTHLLEDKEKFKNWAVGNEDKLTISMNTDYNSAMKAAQSTAVIDPGQGTALLHLTMEEYDQMAWEYKTFFDGNGKEQRIPLNRMYSFSKSEIEKNGYLDLPVWFQEKPKGDYEFVDKNGEVLKSYKIIGKSNPRSENAMFGGEGTGHMMTVRFDNLEDAYKEIENQYQMVEIYQNMEMVEHLLKSKKYQDELNSITTSNSMLYDADGNWNVTADNWQAALGDQSMTLLASIFSLGAYTFVAESGGVYIEALELHAQAIHGADWESMSVEEKQEEYCRIVDQNPEIIDMAFTVGGINMMLDNISNVFLIGKVSKPVTANLGDAYQLFIAGNVKAAIQNAGIKKGVIDMSKVTVMESLTEVLQEGNTQLGLGHVVDGYQFNMNPLVNAGATAFLTTPIFVGGGKATMATWNHGVLNKIRSLKADPGMITEYCINQRKDLNKQRADNKITQKEYIERMSSVDATQKVFGNINNADQKWTDKEVVEKLFEAQLEIEKQNIEARKFIGEINKAKKQYENHGSTFEQAKNQAELDAIIKEIASIEYQKLKLNHLNNYKTEGIIKASEINNNPDIPYQAKSFETVEQAVKYLTNYVGLNENQIDQLFLTGEANGFILTPEQLENAIPGPLREELSGKGVVVMANSTIENNINNGNIFSSNTVHHEFDHIILSTKTDQEVMLIVETIENEFSKSTDPQMQEILEVYNLRLKQYEKQFGKDYMNTRAGMEEKLAAVGDAMNAIYNGGFYLDEKGTPHYLEGVITSKNNTSFTNIAKVLEDIIHGGREKINGSFDNKNVIPFLSKLKTKDVDFATTLNDNGIPIVVPTYSLSGGGGVDLQIVRDAANIHYKPNRTQQEIVKENERLEEKIKEAENYVNEDKELQAKVRAGTNAHREKLMFNNWGAFEEVLKKYDRSNPLHSTLNEELFNSENLESFVKAVMITWQPQMLDKESGKLKSVPFAAYYFGSKDGLPSIATRRQAAIFEKLDKQFTEDLTDLNYVPGEPTEGDVIENSINLMDQVEDYNERSELVHTIPGFEYNENTGQGNEAYENWITNVQEVMVKEYEGVYDENFKSKIRKEGRKFWKQLVDGFEGKVTKDYLPTELYINFITEQIELIYNQMPQKVMNENFTEFTDIVVERMDADQSKMRKDLKTGDIYSGTSLREKKEFTPEVREAFLEKLLKTNQIADLKAEGLTNAEIHKIVRMDMTTKGTLQHLSDILFKDAVMQATNNPEFKETHGVDKQQIMQAAMMLDRGMDVKFSLTGDNAHLYATPKEIKSASGVTLQYKYNNSQYFQDATALISRVVEPYYQQHEGDILKVIDEIMNNPALENINDDIKIFIADQYDTKRVMDGETRDFVQFIKTSVPGISPEVLKDVVGVGVKDRKDIRDNMVLNAKELMDVLPKEVIDYLGLEFIGFKGGDRYLDITAKDNKGEHLQDHKDVIGMSKTAEELGIVLDFDPKDISIYNKSTPLKSNGIFKEIINLNERIAKGEITKIQAKKIIEETGLIEKIEKANNANMGALKLIYKSMAVKLKDGSLNEAALLQLFKMQSNLVGGFRGLSRLDGYNLLNGKFTFNPKDKGVTWTTNKKGEKIILWKGEHAASMSKVDANVIQLMYEYKNGNINDALFNAQLEVELAGYGQVLGHNGHFDILDEYGKTNITDTKRFNLLSPRILSQYQGIRGESLKDMQIKIAIDLDRKQSVVNTIKKEVAIQNIQVARRNGIERSASVFDFDGTLEEGGKNIIVATHPTLGKIEIASHDFHNVVSGLTEKGYEFNFDDFVNVKESKKGPLFEKFKNQIEKYGVDNVIILTARQPGAAVAIQAWLEQNGVSLPLENITGLGVMGPDGKPITVKGTDKAKWIEQNLIWDGFSDIFFVDDGQQIVEDVQAMFNTYPPGMLKSGGKSVLVDPDYEISLNEINESFPSSNIDSKYSLTGPDVDLNKTFNEILESSTEIGAEKVFSKAEGTIRGDQRFSVRDIIYPASAYDLETFTYRYITSGALGENQKAFFQEKLFKPFALANNQINQKKQQVKNDYKALVKELPVVKKSLKDNVEGTNFTKEQAIRVKLWTDAGFEIPGLAPTTQEKLIKAVNNDPELIAFAEKLSILSGQENGYIKPSEYWTVENIAFDLSEVTGSVGRADFLKGWKHNVDQIFSEENKNKLRAAYGNEHVEALEDMLYRMEYGTNRSKPGRIENAWNNWVNNSVGAIMFFNMRSAFLQTISAVNYVGMGDNNILEAGKRLSNVPQFSKDFAYIFNSDMLKQRREGNTRTVNEAEIAERLQGAKNPTKALIAYCLEKGFLPTQIADSFAIASGGATFYRSKVIAYEKQGMSTKEAEAQAWIDFQEKTEMGQQSSRPDLISQQQAGGLGRLLLAFKNTPMQYTRIMLKAVSDLKNGRGSVKENIGKIAYYGAVQNIIFTSLQTALWAALGDEEEWGTKQERVANGMIDTILNGFGLTGAISVTIKNAYLRYSKEDEKDWNADHTRTILEFANLSPTIGSKLRKLYSAIQTEQFNEDVIDKMGWNIENPGFNSVANLISATTNIPLDRAVQKAQNLILASKSETEFFDKLALTLGWNPWDLGLEKSPEVLKAKEEVKIEKEIKKKEETKIKKEIKKKEEIKKKVEEGKEKQKKEKEEGKQLTCLVCKNPVVEGKKHCTVHEKKPERTDGKEVKCKYKYPKGHEKVGEQCGMTTSSKSGYCVYHD